MDSPHLYINRYIASLSMQGDSEFMDFLAEVRPQVVQMGFYCPQLYGLADIAEVNGPQWGGGYPMSLPVVGLTDNLDWQRNFNRRVHDLGGRVIGHFSMTLAWGNTQGRTGFFDFYDRLWPTDLLGEKPVERCEDLLQVNPDGTVHLGDRWGFPRTAGCSNNPHWREIHRRMVEVAINLCDVDGFITCYNYHFGCTCIYCNEAFRTYLTERFDTQDLNQRFGISNLENFSLDGTLARVTGWVNTESIHPVALQIEAMRFAQITWKKHYDEIFIDTGRGLKSDLILGSWNHLGAMQPGQDERNVVPLELWGRGENLFWYSTGSSSGSIANGDLGDRMLNSLWILEMGAGKMPIQGHYENTRVRASIAEGLATRGPGMGLYCLWRDPSGRRAYRNYFDFCRRWYDYFHPVTSAAEIALVFPRRALIRGDDGPVDTFRRAGEELLRSQILFDILCDERIDNSRLKNYTAVILPEVSDLSPQQQAILKKWSEKQRLLTLGKCDVSDWEQSVSIPTANLSNIVANLYTAIPALSRITADSTVRVVGWTQPGRRLLHLVNFNRQEGLDSGPAHECPILAENIPFDLKLPTDNTVSGVDFISPDEGYNRSRLPVKVQNGRASFHIPALLVYGIVVVRLIDHQLSNHIA